MKTDFETLRDNYPLPLRRAVVRTKHLKFLSKYVLEKGKSYKRSEIISRILELHAKLGGISEMKRLKKSALSGS